MIYNPLFVTKVNNQTLGWTDKQSKVSLDTAIDGILVVSKKAKPRTVHQVLGKCTEELGEMATIINKPKKKHDEPLVSEFADLLISGVDLIYIDVQKRNPDMTDDQVSRFVLEQLSAAIVNKTKKWSNSI